MSKRSDRAAERKAIKQAEKDLKKARASARKAFDLRDPRFLGEAAVAATRGPVGLALFGASRGLQVARDRRAEQAEILGDLAADAKQHADAVREQTSVLAAPPAKRRPVRRFAPLWIAGLTGGAAIAAATAYFLRDPGSSPSSSSPSPAPTPPATPSADTVSGTGPGAGSAPQPAGAETGEDLTIDSADPEGPAGQDAATTPAAESAAPGVAAGSAPQPSDEKPEDGTPDTK